MRHALFLSASLPLLLGGCGEKSSSEGLESAGEKPTAPSEEVKPTGEAPVSPHLKYETEGDAVTITGCDKKASGALTIPATIEGKPVNSIGNEALRNCGFLTSITIPDSVTSIGEAAFFMSSNLTSITIGDSVTSIGDYTFSQCRSLTTIEVSAGNVNFTDVNGVLFNAEKTVLHTYPAGKTGDNYTMPDSVNSIGDDAFYGSQRLTSITIPDGVTSIGNNAFSAIHRLKSITIPDGVTSIGQTAFMDCTRLTSITIGDSVTSIGDHAFDGCRSLTAVTFLGDAPEVGNKSFSTLTNTTIYRKSETKGWGDTFDGRPVRLISEKP